ncbi:MAG: metal ABC transporter solute-binding protein, Zn/Mn family [Acidimicrobiales bacterium]
MTKDLLLRASSLVVLVAAGLVATACSVAVKAQGEPRNVVQVVAAEDMWGNVAAQIGGRHASVTSLVSSPNVDPHIFEATAEDAAAVALARVVIYNGANYDDWMAQLVATGSAGSAGSTGSRKVIVVQHVLGVAGPAPNPHFWYATKKVGEVASAIEAALVRADPADAGYFAARLRVFQHSLSPLFRVIAEIRRQHGGAHVAFTEPVASYLIEEAGLASLTPMGFALSVENGLEPSPGDTKTFEDLIAGHRLSALIYNSQTVSPATEQVRAEAAKVGVPVVAMSETIPTKESFQAWQLAQDEALLRALGR